MSAVAGQLRRRRSASRRSTVLLDGRRDTLDNPRPRTPVRYRNLGGTDEYGGPGVAAAIRDLGIRNMRARQGGAWWVPAGPASDDLMALLESRGYRIEPIL